MGIFDFFGKHEIDDWRDGAVETAAMVLNQVAADLLVNFERDLKTASWKDALVGQRGFIASRIAPRIREVAEPVVAKIVEEANRSLAAIVDHEAVWHARPSASLEQDGQFEGWQDLAAAAGPLASGMAAATVLPSMAFTTSTAFFGLVTTTAISWPVVVGGSAFVGVAIVTGVLNTGKVRDKAKARLRQKIRLYVVEALLRGRKSEPSILEQLAALFAKAAEEAKKF